MTTEAFKLISLNVRVLAIFEKEELFSPGVGKERLILCFHKKHTRRKTQKYIDKITKIRTSLAFSITY